jgi:2-polyprenyl-3-methyl-5-hydroxy-6-metoxy-1,4-benzoquinol methylase
MFASTARAGKARLNGCVSEPRDLRQHWEAAYAKRGVEGVSWYEPVPAVSLALLDALGVEREASVLDVGGGASHLADELVARGFTDVTVVDLSEAALAAT